MAVAVTMAWHGQGLFGCGCGCGRVCASMHLLQMDVQ